MNCDICGRQHQAQRLPFLCAVDARNKLYDKRLAHARALIENESLEKQIDALLASDPNAKNSAAAQRVRIDDWRSDQRRAVRRTDEIIAQADRLKADVEAAREDIKRRKTLIARRKSDLASASSGIAARRERQLDDVERSIGMMTFKWNRSYDSMAATRGFLCMEAARLYGLRRLKKGTSSRYGYEVGGIEIPDMSSLNALSPETISTSLSHMTHILMLASHYLAIRLPAEITLPHPDYPRPTIFSLASSYSHGEIPFPGTSSLHAPAPEARQAVHRPRPLFIEKPLPILSKEDPQAYIMFMEGVALLAYDIAWACCSQGVPIGERKSYEDVANMGRNLYNLLIGNQLHSNPAGRIFSTSSGSSSPQNKPDDGGLDDLATAGSLMGRQAHGTAHDFLSDIVTRSFKLHNPKMLCDWMKSKLNSEAPMPDWEMLEDDAWAVDEQADKVNSAKGHTRSTSDGTTFGVESLATVKTALDASRAEVGALPRVERSTEKTRRSGTNGWTKLKSR